MTAINRISAIMSDPVTAVPRQWPCETVVIGGDDRQDLLQRVKALHAQLALRPDTELLDLAYTSYRQLPASGCRLAIVAADMAELAQRLERAAKRLADPKCQQIRDSLGIYFTAEPFYPAGKIAFLFPGEGAQYLNMLGDLCPYFPEFDEFLRSCEQVRLDLGAEGRSLLDFFHFPDDASPAERAAAEAELRGLGNAMYSVVIGDWALFQLLSKLGLRADYLAGHSMGELVALMAGDTFSDDFPIGRMVETVRRMETDEADEQAEQAVLLAVGASKQAMETLVRQTLGCMQAGATPAVYVAMDNCPHQSVLVGLADAMAPIEAALQAQRFVYERLALSRPYHTPLFQPFLGPLVEFFAGVEFRPATTPVYSCTTGELFPADLNEVRRLTVAHWASPVEFTRVIESMHAAGARLFIEVGPRGNLSAFTEDILRGKPQWTVPANVQRRSGMLQLQHLLAQLSAQHVPLNWEVIYQGRQPRLLDWMSATQDGAATGRGVVPAAVASPTPRAATTAPAAHTATESDRGAVDQYLSVMDQFLQTQELVMRQYLERERRPPAMRQRQPRSRGRMLAAPPAAAPPAIENPVVPMPPSTAPTPGPLVGDVVEHQPQRRLVVQRRMDLAEDLYAQDHTVGGRGVSQVDPHQHGLPVGPMTFSLEMMAEVASLLCPGMIVQGVRNVELMRWLAFDEVDPNSVQVTAEVVDAPPHDPLLPTATRQVRVEIVDLGNSTQRPPPKMRWTAALGTVLLGESFPVPPPAGELALTDERPCRISLESLYQNLFHGEKFQGVTRLGRYGPEGVESDIVVMPRDQLFRSNPDPRFHFDPVLVDIAMHPLAAWHLEQPDQAGRVLLPFGLESIQLFGPMPAVGRRLVSRVRTVQTRPRQFVHAVDALDEQGNLLFRLTGAKYWRFYVPFGEVNFHGPKDGYFISRQAPEIVERLPADAQIVCSVLDPPLDLLQPAMRLAFSKVAFSTAEQAAYRQLTVRDAEKSEWLFSRMVAKDATRIHWSRTQGERLFPADMEIDADEHQRLLIRHRQPGNTTPLPRGAHAHDKGRYVALSTCTDFAGIDLIKLDADAASRLPALSVGEQQLLAAVTLEPTEAQARLAVAKRAMARALGGDLRCGDVEIESFDAATGQAVARVSGELAARWPKLAGQRLRIETSRDEAWIFAVTICQQVSV